MGPALGMELEAASHRGEVLSRFGVPDGNGAVARRKPLSVWAVGPAWLPMSMPSTTGYQSAGTNVRGPHATTKVIDVANGSSVRREIGVESSHRDAKCGRPNPTPSSGRQRIAGGVSIASMGLEGKQQRQCQWC